MRIVAISDCRTTTAEQIDKLCERERPDLLIYAGDDVARFGPVPDEVYFEAGAEHLRRLSTGQVPRSGIFEPHRWGAPRDFGRMRGFGFGSPSSTSIRVRSEEAAQSWPDRSLTFHEVAGQRWGFEIPAWARPRSTIDGLALAKRIPHGVAGVLGNDCLPTDAWVLRQPGWHDLHASPLLLPGIAIIGLAGAPYRGGEGRGFLLYDEAAAARHLEAQLRRCGDRDIILVSHAPPYEILDFAVRHGAENIGSTAVRDLVDHGRVAVVVCGHVHREGGSSTLVGPECAVVNVACHDNRHADLRYAVIAVEPEAFDITHGEIRNDDLFQVSGVGPKNVQKLRAAGVKDLDQLATIDREILVRAMGPKRGPKMQAHARSLLSGSPVLISGRPTMPEQVIYLDVETSHRYKDDPWLIGALFPDGRFDQWQQLDLDRHPRHLRALDERLGPFTGATFVQWGGFDRAALRRAYARCGLAVPGWLDKARWLDALSWLQWRVALPITSLGLKDVCRLFDYQVRHPDLCGLTVGSWYTRYRDEGTQFDTARAAEYNEDDVRALAHVMRRVCELGPTSAP